MSQDTPKRADKPIRMLDFVNDARSQGADMSAPQPLNNALAEHGAISAEGMVIVSSRELVQEALRKATVFSSSDLVEQ